MRHSERNSPKLQLKSFSLQILMKKSEYRFSPSVEEQTIVVYRYTFIEFGGIWHLLIQTRKWWKYWTLSTKLHGVTTKRIIILYIHYLFIRVLSYQQNISYHAHAFHLWSGILDSCKTNVIARRNHPIDFVKLSVERTQSTTTNIVLRRLYFTRLITFSVLRFSPVLFCQLVSHEVNKRLVAVSHVPKPFVKMERSFSSTHYLSKYRMHEHKFC
jgi:hypothetical protein